MAAEDSPEDSAPPNAPPPKHRPRTHRCRTCRPERAAPERAAPDVAIDDAAAANYDELSIASLRARLRILDVTQVRELADYERRTRAGPT